MTKRLQKELKEFLDEPKDWCKAELVNEDSLFHWRAEITGPDKSPYEKGIFKLEIEIPTDYPFKPPKVKFVTKIYHPNVRTKKHTTSNFIQVKGDGSFCTDILTTEGWSPQLKISQVLLTIRQLMLEPNPDNPLEAEIAQIFKNDRNAFNKTAKEWTKKYAKE